MTVHSIWFTKLTQRAKLFDIYYPLHGATVVVIRGFHQFSINRRSFIVHIDSQMIYLIWTTIVSGSTVCKDNETFEHYVLLKYEEKQMTLVATKTAEKLLWAQPS